jgi:hypothetical protein
VRRSRCPPRSSTCPSSKTERSAARPLAPRHPEDCPAAPRAGTIVGHGRGTARRDAWRPSSRSSSSRLASSQRNLSRCLIASACLACRRRVPSKPQSNPSTIAVVR